MPLSAYTHSVRCHRQCKMKCQRQPHRQRQRPPSPPPSPAPAASASSASSRRGSPSYGAWHVLSLLSPFFLPFLPSPPIPSPFSDFPHPTPHHILFPSLFILYSYVYFHPHPRQPPARRLARADPRRLFIPRAHTDVPTLYAGPHTYIRRGFVTCVRQRRSRRAQTYTEMRTYRGAVLSCPVLSRVSGRRPSRRVHTAGSREAGCRHPRVRAMRGWHGWR